jgi:putative two-component system response regulator
MTKILVAEDDDLLRDVIYNILVLEGYEVFSTVNGRQALDSFVSVKPDLIVSDIMMPEMDGFELLEEVRSLPLGVTMPFLFLTARTERSDVKKARALGVDDYLFKPFDAWELIEAVRTRLNRRKAVELFDTRAAHLQTVVMLGNVIEARDPYTAGHVDRVRRLALSLGFALNWNTEEIAILEFGAVLHDIGKIMVPRHVLTKAGPLDDEEWELMRQHPQVGAQMLEGVDHLRPAIPYVLYHHEWWNGGGYPFRLKGADIPPEGRLLAIVDAFDAMTSNRPYRKGLSVADTLVEIRKNSGVYFDPEMVEVFLQTYKE